MPYMCDFEANTGNIVHTRVWAWACCNIEDPDQPVITGNDITTYMAWLKQMAAFKETVYFHNLKYDGEFIVNHLLKTGWQPIEQANKARKNTFTMLISGSGAWYQLKLYFARNKYVTIIDSYKIIPLGVEKIPGAFGLEEAKGSIDYELYRDVGYIPTAEEIEYITLDVRIVTIALGRFFREGLNRMTIGSNALYEYQQLFGDYYRYFFPDIAEVDPDIRKSYRGGFTYVNPKYQGMDIGEGIVLDVNSLYPSRMKCEQLPYGVPQPFEGLYEYDEKFPLFVQHFSCCFKLKPDHIPMIQIKNSLYFLDTEYAVSSNDEEIDLWLTSVDLDLFLDQYDTWNETFYGGYKFRAGSGMFDQYIDKWMRIKQQATIDHNKGLRSIAKLMLNSLYGKFGTNPHVTNRTVKLDTDGACEFDSVRLPDRKPVYIPMAAFITAYARSYTIRAAQSVYDRFIYADTDSLHLIGNELPAGLEIDPVKVGAWKHESSFKRARFIRAKCYIEEEKDGLKVTCAGMPNNLHDQVTWDNFRPHKKYWGKLFPKHIDGGVILVPGPFTISG